MAFSHDEIGLKGKYVRIKSLKVNDLTLVVTGRFVKTIRLKEEEYQDVHDPYELKELLSGTEDRPDILTFIQRFPDIDPRYDFKMESERFAVLEIISYEDWIEHKISQNSKRAIEKARKKGVEIRLPDFNDEFIKGMVSLFNESPVRQKKPFWHYGKDFDTVKREFSRYLFREDIIGAYSGDELIGFVFLANAGNYAIPTQIISKIAHREKGVTNALLAKAVEICAGRGLPYIVYGNWQDSSLDEFKRRNGFQKVEVPRYFVPLTAKGELLTKLGLHRGIFRSLPIPIQRGLLMLRSKWQSRTLPRVD